MRALRTFALCTALVLSSAGCAALRIEPTDNPAATTGKVIGRVLLATVTAGESERTYALWRQSAAMNRMMSSWVGHSYSELLFKWGRPSDVFPDGSGGYVLVYFENRSMTTPGTSTTTTRADIQTYDYGLGLNATGTETSRTVYSPALTRNWTVFRNFRVRTDGTITEWSWRGI